MKFWTNCCKLFWTSFGPRSLRGFPITECRGPGGVTSYTSLGQSPERYHHRGAFDLSWLVYTPSRRMPTCCWSAFLLKPWFAKSFWPSLRGFTSRMADLLGGYCASFAIRWCPRKLPSYDASVCSCPSEPPQCCDQRSFFTSVDQLTKWWSLATGDKNVLLWHFFPKDTSVLDGRSDEQI